MFILINKKGKKGYASESFKEISNKSGFRYNRLSYLSRKKEYYEDMEMIFVEVETLKSKQGGKREKKYDE
jgi:hypothetical protein